MQIVPYTYSSLDSTPNDTLVIVILLSLLSLGVISAIYLVFRIYFFTTSLFRRHHCKAGVDQATQTTLSPRTAWLLYCDVLARRSI